MSLSAQGKTYIPVVMSLTAQGKTYIPVDMSLTAQGKTFIPVVMSLTAQGKTYIPVDMSLTAQGKTYIPGVCLLQHKVKILSQSLCLTTIYITKVIILHSDCIYLKDVYIFTLCCKRHNHWNKSFTLCCKRTQLAERFLQSLGFRRLSSVSRRPSYVFTFESSPLKVLGQTERKNCL
jgi:hypothetical protein